MFSTHEARDGNLSDRNGALEVGASFFGCQRSVVHVGFDIIKQMRGKLYLEAGNRRLIPW